MEMIERARAASVLGVIRGLLFFQGENDAEGKQDDNPDTWGAHFAKFVSDVRTDLEKAELKIVFAQIKADGGLSGIVKSQQESVRLPQVVMIKTDDLETQMRQDVHFTTDSYIELGRRFAKEFLIGGD